MRRLLRLRLQPWPQVDDRPQRTASCRDERHGACGHGELDLRQLQAIAEFAFSIVTHNRSVDDNSTSADAACHDCNIYRHGSRVCTRSDNTGADRYACRLLRPRRIRRLRRVLRNRLHRRSLPAAPLLCRLLLSRDRIRDDADLLMNALHAKGYQVSERTEAQDKLIHVQVGPFATKADAEAMRERLIVDGYNAIVK